MDLRIKNLKKGDRIDNQIFSKIKNAIKVQLNLSVKSLIIKQIINDRYYLIDIHYDFYNTKYSCLRGAIFDNIESKFFLVSDVLPKEEVVFTPLRGFYNDGTIYYRGYDGCVLRIFELDGSIIYSTNRCVDTRDKRIFTVKDSRTFEQIMKEVAGVNNDSEKAMFEGDNKNKIHFFLIVTKETYLFMQGDIEEKVFYVGSKSKYEIGPSKKLEFFRNFCNIKHFEPISITEANKILGFDIKRRVIDTRLDMENSGFVIRENLFPPTKTFLYSEGYQWRKFILGLKRSDKIVSIYLELKERYIKNITEYKEMFPYIKIIKEGENVKVIPLKYPEKLTKEQLEENLINCLYLVLPKSRKSEVFQLQKHINDTIREIATLIKENKIPNDEIYNPKIEDFLKRVSGRDIEEIEKIMKEETEGEIIYLLGRILKKFD